MFLGIDTMGLLYEGVGSTPDRLVPPIPMVSQARLIADRSQWGSMPAGYRGAPLTWLYREEFFDAVTRTRRGRLYQYVTGASYPDHNVQVMPHPFEDPGGRNIGQNGKLRRPLNMCAAGTSFLEQPRSGLGCTLALGNNLAASDWRIVDVEITVSDDMARSSFALVVRLNAGVERTKDR